MAHGTSRRSSIWCGALLILVGAPLPAHAEAITIIQSAEYQGGYERTLFKHWVDADRNGCDTRKEVLIAEATIKPSVGTKCALSGGTWYSSYDNKTMTNSSSLDIDHVVPLAEAWRSGAWAWTPEQREAFANDISDPQALIAVTASTNRAKGDSDPKDWMPSFNQCSYIEAWVNVKLRYALTFDTGEVSTIRGFFSECKNLKVRTPAVAGYSTTLNPTAPAYESVTLEVARDSTSSAEQAALTQVRLYGKCTIAGSKAHSVGGERLTCKKTQKDSKLKWRK